MEENRPKTIKIEVGSIVSARTKEGMIELVVNNERVQMDLQKAREITMFLLNAIEAATSDMIVFKLLTQKVGLSETEAGILLVELRELRQGSKGTVFVH